MYKISYSYCELQFLCLRLCLIYLSRFFAGLINIKNIKKFFPEHLPAFTGLGK